MSLDDNSASAMIGEIDDPELRRLYERDDGSGLPPEYLDTIRRVLSLLDVATTVSDLGLPGIRLQSDQRARRHFVHVGDDWWIAFVFDGDTPVKVDLVRR